MQLYVTMLESIKWNRFPSSLAILLTLYTTIQNIFISFYEANPSISIRRLLGNEKPFILRLSRFVAAFVSANLSFMILNAGDKAESPTVNGQILYSTKPPRPRNQSPTEIQGDQLDQIPSVSKFRRYREVTETTRLAGRTIDLTILVTIRAIEALVVRSWANIRQQRTRVGRSRRLVESCLHKCTDSGIFALSAGIVMYGTIVMLQSKST